MHHLILNHSYAHIKVTYIHGVAFFFAPSPTPLAPLAIPLYTLPYSLSLTWRPPAVTGTVLPLIRLLVD